MVKSNIKIKSNIIESKKYNLSYDERIKFLPICFIPKEYYDIRFHRFLSVAQVEQIKKELFKSRDVTYTLIEIEEDD